MVLDTIVSLLGICNIVTLLHCFYSYNRALYPAVYLTVTHHINLNTPK